ncbi:MAG: hypothetical protein ACPGXK_04265 [Phycisphaerae bacterium]
MMFTRFLERGCLLAVGFSLAGALHVRAEDPGWPRVYKDVSGEVTIYQPQVESWEDRSQIDLKAAVAVVPKGEQEPNYGVLSFSAKTRVNHDDRTVLVTNPDSHVDFPGLDEERAGFFKAIVRLAVPKKKSMVVSLDRLIANTERSEILARDAKVNLDPPPIFYSDIPAILVTFLGEARFQPISGTNLMFATNTNWDLLMETGSSRYYLLVEDGWLSSSDVMKGPWNPSTKLPDDLSKLPDDENWEEIKKHIPGRTISLLPQVFVSDRPAELLITDGKPQLSPIEQLPLMYVANTESDLFFHTQESNYYLLVAGRWFRAKEVSGPWSNATQDLPAVFAEIPENHARASVLASVPGTREAEEAVIQASIPTKATVKRSEVSTEVTYDGEPAFKMIEGSDGVRYAVNTASAVFRVGDKYYCCDNGIWFCASKPEGEWDVCGKVDEAIYSIPATSPYHNVTYVYIYEDDDDDDDEVVVGYTAGYSGAYVAYGALMFGAGYWLGHHDHYDNWWYWRHSPCYYSYGVRAHYSYYHGGFVRGARYYGPYGGAGFGARYNPWTGTYARGARIYGPYGSAGVARAYNPWTGTRARGRYASGPRGTVASGRAYNPRTGRGAATRQVRTPYGSWGKSVVRHGDDWARFGHTSTRRGTTVGVGTSNGGKAAVHKGDNGWTYGGKTKSGDVFVGHDGKVYRKDNNGDWERHSNRDRGWKKPDWKSEERLYGRDADRTRDRGSGMNDRRARDTRSRGAGREDAQTSRQRDRSTRQRSSASRTRSTRQRLDRDSHSRSRGRSHSMRSRSRGGGRRGGRR